MAACQLHVKEKEMEFIEATDDVEQFCRTINASMVRDRLARNAALRDVSLPDGFRHAVLRYPVTGEFAAAIYSRTDHGGKLALHIASSMSRSGSSIVRPAAHHELQEQTMNLVVDDGRHLPSSKYSKRP